MDTRRILVTGAGGYIGRHVVTVALDAGYDVFALDISKKGIDSRAKLIDYPIFDKTEDVFEKLGRPDVLIHLAWKDGFIHNSPAHMACLSQHVVFLKHMLDGGLKTLSVMGSMHEVGYWEGAIRADTPCAPLSQYGVAKNALRQSLMLYTEGKDTQLNWLRAYYIFGDDAHGSSIFSKITQAAQAGQREFPFTTGKNKYDFISVQQLARQIVAASVQKKHSGIINVCTGKPVRLAEQIEWFIKDNHYDISLKYGTFPNRPYDSPGVWGDADIINAIMKEYSCEEQV